jgi:hypothetical protein
MQGGEPITAEWLSAHGWKLGPGRNDGNTQLPGFRLLPVGDKLICGRLPFHSHDDLCIAVAPTTSEGDGWYVWVYQIEPYRFIHVRPMYHTHELVRLWEGLTGRDWPTTRKT